MKVGCASFSLLPDLAERAKALGPIRAHEDEPALVALFARLGTTRQLAERFGERRRNVLRIEPAHERPPLRKSERRFATAPEAATEYIMGARVLLRRSRSRKASKPDQALRNRPRNA